MAAAMVWFISRDNGVTWERAGETTTHIKEFTVSISFEAPKPVRPAICPCGIHRPDCEYHREGV